MAARAVMVSMPGGAISAAATTPDEDRESNMCSILPHGTPVWDQTDDRYSPIRAGAENAGRQWLAFSALAIRASSDTAAGTRSAGVRLANRKTTESVLVS